MPVEVGIGTSTEREPLHAVKEAVEQARKTIGGNINLAIVFSSIDLSYQGLPLAISNILGPVAIVGCSSLAVISGQGIFKHGLAIMLLGFSDGDYAKTACVKDVRQKGSLAAGEELAEQLLAQLSGAPRNLSLIFSDGLIESGSELITGLQEKLGSSFPLVGASASDNLSFKNTYLYFQRDMYSDAVCGIIWGQKLTFGLGVHHGWEPLGKPRYITKSHGNIVTEIDGQPAVKIYEDYFAKKSAKLKKELKRISILYPIGIYLPGEEEYLLRNIFAIEDDGSIIFQGNVSEGSQIRLMIGTKESCLEATQRALDEAKKQIMGHRPRFALVFDSASRFMLLGRRAVRELEIIKAGLNQDTPIIGLYTYGEQAPLRALNYLGKTYFHNQTITILVIGD